MDKMTKLRRLCLQWVFVLEGYGNIEKWPEADRKEIEEDLRQENKHPDQWTDDERIDFMNQIIENAEQNQLYIKAPRTGKPVNGHVPGPSVI